MKALLEMRPVSPNVFTANILRACIVAGLIFGIDSFQIPKLELAIIYDFVMFVEGMLSILVLNDIQIPQNLLKFMDSLHRKPAYTCSFN